MILHHNTVIHSSCPLYLMPLPSPCHIHGCVNLEIWGLFFCYSVFIHKQKIKFAGFKKKQTNLGRLFWSYLRLRPSAIWLVLLWVDTYFLEISLQQDLISRHCTMWQQSEGGVYRDRHARTYTASTISLLILYACIIHMRIHISLSILYHVARFWGRHLLGWVS